MSLSQALNQFAQNLGRYQWQAKEISLENGRFGMVLARNINNEAKERGALLSASGARGTIGDYD